MKNKDEKQTEIDQASYLEVLVSQYELIMQRFEKAQEYLLQILGISLAASPVVIGYLGTQNVPFLVAWFIPIFIFFFYGLIIFLLQMRGNYYWIARILGARINLLLSEIAITDTVKEYPSARWFSSRRGNIRFRFLMGLLVVMGFFAAVGILILCFFVIYQTNHAQGSLFVSIYFMVVVILLLAFFTIDNDLPKLFRKLEEQIDDIGRMPSRKEFDDFTKDINFETYQSTLYKLIPRPWDITAKGLYFWFGFTFAFLLGRINPESLPIMNLLFSTAIPWTNIQEVPWYGVLCFGLILFFAHELLLQQAKLLWDDIRDVKRDQYLALNRRRAFATGALDINSSIANIIIRTCFAFIIGFFFGGIGLVIIFGLILAHQVVYVMVGKPRIQRHPGLVLFWLSFNTPLRFVAGAFAAGRWDWASPIILLVIILTFFNSYANSALFWRIEADDLVKKKEQNSFRRPQSQYFYNNGRKYQRLALFATIYISLIILTLSRYWVINNAFIANISTLYQQLPGGLFFTISLFFIFTIAYLSEYLTRQIILFFSRVKKIEALWKGAILSLSNLSLLAGIVLFVMGLLKLDFITFVFGYLLYQLAFGFMYEYTDYDDYTMVHLKDSFSVFLKLLKSYLFTSDSDVNLKLLIGIFIDEKTLTLVKTKIQEYSEEKKNIEA